MKKVGVLALQGDFEAHSQALARVGAEPVLTRTASDLDGLDGLVIPGGESTTMLKLMNIEGMIRPLVEFGQKRPIFGTCLKRHPAGLGGYSSGPTKPGSHGFDSGAQRVWPADR